MKANSEQFPPLQLIEHNSSNSDDTTKISTESVYTQDNDNILRIFFREMEATKGLNSKENVLVAQCRDRGRNTILNNLGMIPLFSELLLKKWRHALDEGKTLSFFISDILSCNQGGNGSKENNDDTIHAACLKLEEAFKRAQTLVDLSTGLLDPSLRTHLRTRFADIVPKYGDIKAYVSRLNEEIHQIKSLKRTMYATVKTCLAIPFTDFELLFDAHCTSPNFIESLARLAENDNDLIYQCYTDLADTQAELFKLEATYQLPIPELIAIHQEVTFGFKDYDDAIVRMVEGNLGLVRQHVRTITRSNSKINAPLMEQLDMIQTGTLGLLRAAEKYRWETGYAFSTYAMYWIKQAISREFKRVQRTVRLPLNVVNQVDQITAIIDNYMLTSDKGPNDAELAKLANMPEAKVKELLLVSQGACSFEELYDSSIANDIPHSIATPGVQSQNPEDTHFVQERSDTLLAQIAELDDECQHVVDCVFYQNMSAAETARHLCATYPEKYPQLTESKVYFIRNKALQLLRQQLGDGAALRD